MIKNQSLYVILDHEFFAIVLALCLGSFVFYRAFMKNVSRERHRNIRNHLRGILRHFVIFSVLFALYLILYWFVFDTSRETTKILPYFGLVCAAWGTFLIVISSRLLLLQYLFLGAMGSGVPLLIVNIYTLMVSLLLGLWGVVYLFGVNLAPFLATSAALSIILGLAMQETLGNLFAGISLQMDRCFEIGDWLEVYINGQKVTGLVKEISWRSTVLVGWTDEVITIPNRLVANAQISNFAGREVPILRSQAFRIPYGVNIPEVRDCLLNSLKKVPQAKEIPPPLCLVVESADSCLIVKLIYYVDNYGSQFLIGDQVIEQALSSLKETLGIVTAVPIMEIRKSMDHQTQASGAAGG